MTKTLLEYVRYMIGEGGPQLPTEEYNARIDDELERLSNSDLLDYIGEYLNGGYRP